MKADIHPSSYRSVVFQDINNGQNFLVKSTAQTKETIKYEDGQTYPLVKLHITSASHPFYTGQEKVIDVEGRIDKFENRRRTAEAARKKLRAKAAGTGRKPAKTQPKAEKNPDEPAGVEQPPSDEA